MFILEEPYVSNLLASTVVERGVAVLDTPMARRVLAGRGATLASDTEFAAQVCADRGGRLYSNSENSIAWIAEHLGGTDLPRRIALFKDKVRFREALADLYPDYRFAEIALADLAAFDPGTLRMPFVLKPAVGFFSLGVHLVESLAAWPGVIASIHRERESFAHTYPAEVLAFGRFIAEEIIEGDEFAVDAYFDAAGRPVILNIYGHLFAGAGDVSDRVYYTSIDLVERWRGPFTAFLAEVGRRTGLTDFPVHAELRVGPDSAIAPIEINPMRFGGWCAADLAYFAYGVNPYLAYLDGIEPDWTRIAAQRAGRATALVVADLPSTVDLQAIAAVDYDSFVANFSQPLELRPIDCNRYPVFAFLFVEVPASDLSELRAVLGADLTRYLRMR